MKSIKKIVLIILAVSLVSCAGLKYNATSFNEDKSVTDEALALIKKSGENYSLHATEADNLKNHVLKVYNDEKKRSMNHATTAMWSEVINAKGNLFDLLDLWKSSGKLSPAFVNEAGRQIERLLNSISDLEDHKKK